MVDLSLLDNRWVITLILVLSSNLLKFHASDPLLVYRFIADHKLDLFLLDYLCLEYEFLWFLFVCLLSFGLGLLRVRLPFVLLLDYLKHFLLVVALGKGEVLLLYVLFRTLVDQEFLVLKTNLFGRFVSVLVLTVEVLLGIIVLSDVNFVP